MMNDRPTALTSSEVIRHSKADPIAPKPVFKVPSSPTLTDDSLGNSHDNLALDDQEPYRYTLLPSYQYHDCDASSPSDINSDSSDMLPPPSPCYQPEWIYRRLKSADDNAQDLPVDDTHWPSIIQPRPKAERKVPMLGNTNSCHQSRRRGPSVSSLPSVISASTASTSSLTRTSHFKAKSILTRTSSISTKHSLAKSVKFVDAPTIHYDYDIYDDCSDDIEFGSPIVPPDLPKSKLPRRIKQFIWPSRPSQKPLERLTISAPLVLGSVQSLGDSTEKGSIRSTRSNSSNRSERTGPRTSGPFSLRTASSLDSFHSIKSTNSSRNKLRAFLGKIVT